MASDTTLGNPTSDSGEYIVEKLANIHNDLAFLYAECFQRYKLGTFELGACEEIRDARNRVRGQLVEAAGVHHIDLETIEYVRHDLPENIVNFVLAEEEEEE